MSTSNAPLSASNAPHSDSSKLAPSKSKTSDLLIEKWEGLSGRDKLALIALALFLLVVGGGWGGYEVHRMATEQQESYQTEISDYFWLRSQASNIDPNQNTEQAIPTDQQLSQVLAASGARQPQVLMVGEDAQLAFAHDNQAVVSNIMSAVVNAGYQIKQLNMMQNPDNKVIQVQATVGQ